MYKALLPATLILLSACSSGGGGGNSTAVGSDSFESGRINSITISGIGYQTESQAGILDEDGRFRFQPGETITFLLGDNVIATLAAERQIALLDFLQAELPETAEALLRETGPLHDVTDFDRGINRVTLLSALDQDPNVSGIQLGDTHNQLKSNKVVYDFDVPMAQFTSLGKNDLGIRLANGEPRQNYLDAIELLYELAGKTVKSEQITLVSKTDNLQPTRIETYRYDISGRITSRGVNTDGLGEIEEQYSYAWMPDGRPKGIEARKQSLQATTVYTYADQMTTIQQTIGSTRNETRYALDEQGRIIVQTVLSNGNLLSKSSREYDLLGREQRYREHSLTDDSVNFEIETRYNENGYVSHIMEDFNADGINERITFERYENGSHLAETLIDFELDAGFDVSYRYTYNALGLLTMEEVDADNNGTVDEVYTYTYDQWNNLTRTEVDVDYQFNPGPDEISTKVFDAYGNLVRETLDMDGDGNTEQEREYDYTLLNHLANVTETDYRSGEAITRIQSYHYQSNTLEDGLANLIRPELDRLPQ